MPSPILDTNSNRTTVAVAERRLLDELVNQLPDAAFAIGSKRVSSAEVAAQLQAHLDAMTATNDARVALQLAIQKEHALRKVTRTLVAAIVQYTAGVYGEASPQYVALGFEPRKRRELTAEQKRLAVERRKATRIARHTMGKRQRAAIHGDPNATTSPPKPV